MKGVLMVGLRLSGADQSEKRGASVGSCRDASRPGAPVWAGAPVQSPRQAGTRSPRASNEYLCASLMDPPPLVSARCAGRRPDVRAPRATRATRGEEQCPAITRQIGLLVGCRRVERAPEVHRRGPGVVNAAASGGPQIGPTHATGAGGKEEDLSPVGAQGGALVGSNGIAEFGDQHSGSTSLALS